MTKIEDYSKEIPEEIRRAIRGLDSEYRAAIFVALYKHGELSFSELQKTLEINKEMLNYHRGKLIICSSQHLEIRRYKIYVDRSRVKRQSNAHNLSLGDRAGR